MVGALERQYLGALMATLPRPEPLVTDTDGVMSLTRAMQVITALETTALLVPGNGVLAGGFVTVVSGFSVRIPSGTKLLVEGYAYTLAANQEYSAASASTTVYLWATVTRTAALKTAPTAEDTYALTVTHNTTGSSPGSNYILMAVMTTSGSAVVAINNSPSGKYVRIADPLMARKTEVAASSGGTVQADETIITTRLLISGQVGVYGRLACI